jgi:hypothetical protein
MNAAVPSEANLNLGLFHELQTAMRRQRGARPQFRSLLTAWRDIIPAALAPLARVAREVPAVLILEGIGGFAPASAPRLSEHDSNNIWPRSGSKATSASLPSSFSGSQSGGQSFSKICRMP